jgi:hypothetical protein
MNRCKRILSILIIAALIIGMLPEIKYVAADETTSVESNENGKEEKSPVFDSLEFLTSAFTTGTWVKGTTYQSDKLEYDLPLKNYSTSSLALQATTVYDTDSFEAVAEYVDINGNSKTVSINSGAITYLTDIPFDASVIYITIADKNDENNKTTYTFNVTRPRDTTKTIKATTGFAIKPAERELFSIKYKSGVEGTMFKAGADGIATTTTGVSATQYNYRTYLINNTKEFQLTATTTTVYEHIRYSIDDGATWTELAQGGSVTDTLKIPEDQSELKVIFQIMDDSAYVTSDAENPFEGADVNTYTVWVESVSAFNTQAQMSSVSSEDGDLYTSNTASSTAYTVIIPTGESAANLKFSVSDGATVKVGTAVQTPDDNGIYTLALKTSSQTITVTSEDGSLVSTYTAMYKVKTSGAPDKVVDYLCINSQYTNASYGVSPEATLYSSLKSLGGFGGYITYYYEDAIKNDPANPYGVDFYIYGNSNITSSTGVYDSFPEPGQVWVSENGTDWYALAGSEHYEDTTIWNYTITYSKTASGKTAWTDNQGNSNDGSSYTGNWVNSKYYTLNSLANSSEITLNGILLLSREGTVTGSSTTATYASKTSFGYADYYRNGTIGQAVNPYMENPDCVNGFDIAWAVDENGLPVTLSEVHYIKVVSASNIWAGAFGEKSTEITSVIRATAGSSEASDSSAAETASETTAPESIIIKNLSENTDNTDLGINASEVLVAITDDQVYEIALGSMQNISISLKGLSDDANIYVNNQRINPSEEAEISLGNSEEKLVRVIVQEGTASPLIYVFKLTHETMDELKLISEINVTSEGKTYTATSTDGLNYTLTVPYSENAAVIAITTKDNTTCLVNGEEPATDYTLETGDNEFTIKAASAAVNEAVKLTVTMKEKVVLPDAIGTVTVTVLGDEKHGEDGTVHSYDKTPDELQVWVNQVECTAREGYTVKDIIEQLFEEQDIEYVNAGGNYITEINGLAAMDNGSNSGWLYLLNGAYADYGIADQKVASGDVIIFHYTDDYLEEDFTRGKDNENDDNTENKPEEGDINSSDKEPTEDNGDTTEDTDLEKLQNIYQETLDYLLNNTTPTVGSVGGDWAVLGIALSGNSDSSYAQSYYEAVVKLLKEKESNKLSNSKSTDNSRVILALNALGFDADDVEGYNLIEPLEDLDYVKKQGINGVIFALIALNSTDYSLSDSTENTLSRTVLGNLEYRNSLVEYLISMQLDDGGFALTGDKADPDVTAMAIQALTPFYEAGDKAAVEAVNDAVACLEGLQNENGSFSSYGTANAESTSQVIIALSGLGIDADKDSRFVKSKGSALAALYSFYTGRGTFVHSADGEANQMATEQAALALTAYLRMKYGEADIYDMTTVNTAETSKPDNENNSNGSSSGDNSSDINDSENSDSENNDSDKNVMNPSGTITNGSQISDSQVNDSQISGSQINDSQLNGSQISDSNPDYVHDDDNNGKGDAASGDDSTVINQEANDKPEADGNSNSSTDKSGSLAEPDSKPVTGDNIACFVILALLSGLTGVTVMSARKKLKNNLDY